MRVLLPLVLLTLACAGADEAPRAAEPPPSSEAASFGGTVDTDSILSHRQALLRRIARSATYAEHMLVELDSTLRRWQERMGDPIRVHLPHGAADGYRSEMRRGVEQAFRRWERVGGIPVRFHFTDSAGAEVHVRWVRDFGGQRTGQADVTWDGHGWIRAATLTLATHGPAGWSLTEEAVHTVALHEIGHLLGLGHSDDPRDVMYPSTEIHDITARDRQTAGLLYVLPPGPLHLP